MRKNLVAAAALAFSISALSIGVAGCGEGGPGAGDTTFQDTRSLSAEVKEQTAESKTSKFTLTADVGGQKLDGSGQGRYEGADSALAMVMTMGGQKLEIRFVDRTAYLKIPGIPGTTPQKPWTKVSPGGNDQLSQMLGSINKLVEQNDPNRMLDQVATAGTIKRHEKTQVDGQDATRYDIDLDLAKLSELAPAGLSKSALDQIQQAGVRSLPMQLALNSDNLPVLNQVDMTEAVAKASSKQGAPPPPGKIVLTTKYTGWGEPVTIEAPQPGEIVDMPR